MRAIKTKTYAEGIKVLDRTADLTARAKSAYIRTKQTAEETKQPGRSSPAEYAADSASSATKTAAVTAVDTATALPKLPRALHKGVAETNGSALDAGSPVSHRSLKHTVSHISSSTAQSEALSKSRHIEKRVKTLRNETSAPAEGFTLKSKGLKATEKGQIKTASNAVKTSQKAARQSIKTTKNAAVAAQKSTKAAAKSARMAAHTARVKVKATVKTALAIKRVAVAFIRAARAAVKGLIAVIAAGGWIAVVVILVICMIALLVGSVFGIFFSGEPSPETGKTINLVIVEIDAEYTGRIDAIIDSNPHDELDMSGSRALWKHVLAAYTVRVVTDPDNPMEVATIDDEKATILREVFWDMNTIHYMIDQYDAVHDVLDDDGFPTGETYIETTIVLRITVQGMTASEISALYGFDTEQRARFDELLKPEYNSLWNALLFGVTSIGDGTMVEIALSQLGNVGGEIYWRWYGFSSRVPWCAIFVSWVADQAGYLDAGIIPRFASTSAGVQWFKARGQWQERGYTPAPGDLIFFDWQSDGIVDHVGIVERVEGNYVHTIEGNSSDSVRRRSYRLDSIRIFGYGVLWN